MLKNLQRHSPAKNKLALVILGSVVWAATTVKSGLLYDFGLGFWGPHGHDGIWHIALINSLARGSIKMPIFAGENIQNYHLGFDLALAFLHRLTSIPISTLYFQLVPPVLAVLIGLLSYRLVFNWTKSTVAAWWSVFFVYFGGGLGWLAGAGESALWSQQAISTLVNPPYGLSLVILLVGLILCQRERYWAAALAFALLPHVKIYAGLLAFGGLAVAGLKNRHLYKTLILGLLIYLPTNLQLITNQRLIVFQPGWFLETLFASDRLNWPRFASALNTYRVSGNWLKGIPAYLFAFAVFWIGNMGTRLVKEILVLKWLKKAGSLTWVEWFFASVIIAGGLLPMLFLQSGTPWNTIQFFYYSLFLSSLLAGISLGQILESNKLNKYLKIGICTLIIFLSVPTTVDTLAHYLPSRPPAKISLEELEALSWLSRQPEGIVLTSPVNPDPYAPPPRPLYLYESTAYVSAFSGKPVYLEDQVNLNITGYDWHPRREAALDFFFHPNLEFLKQYNIRYIYLVNSQFRPTSLPATPIFQNPEVTIWKTLP